MHDLLYNELLSFKKRNKVRHLKNDLVFINKKGKPKQIIMPASLHNPHPKKYHIDNRGLVGSSWCINITFAMHSNAQIKAIISHDLKVMFLESSFILARKKT